MRATSPRIPILASRLVLGLVICYGSGYARGQSCESWFANPAAGPSPRFGHRMAYDIGRGVTVLFAGYPLNNQTWEWNGNAWMQRFPATSPPVRDSHAMVYDSARGLTVLFGGSNGAAFRDTWEWNGTTWTPRTPPISPPARWGHGMAYDSTRQASVLFGGYSGGSDLGDTWEWNGTTWTQRFPSNSPSPRSGVALVYDSVRHVSAFFGGRLDSTNTLLGDTWEWNGTNWTQRQPMTSPSARNSHAMVFDSAHGVSVLFGGFVSTGYNNETWEWNGTAWLRRFPLSSPPPVHLHAMAYDSARHVTVLYGGQITAGAIGEAWELTDTKPAVDAGGPYVTSGQDPVSLRGSAGQKSIAWTGSGSGEFAYGGTLSPTYFPSEEDVASGSISLTLTANGPCGLATSTTKLTFIASP